MHITYSLTTDNSYLSNLIERSDYLRVKSCLNYTMSSLALRFQEALNASGYSLKLFFRTTSQDLFPETDYRPDTLKCFAANGDRSIKQFLNNPHGNIRIFYFQLLRLCYMQNLVHTLPFINKVKKVVLDPNFKILFSFDTQQKACLFNNAQFKKLFAEFIDYLDYQEQPCLESAINDYPIMDIVMIHIMRSLLATKNINPDFNSKIDTQQVFKQLASIFRLKLSSFDDYWVLQDSDFIVFAESEWQLYISYKQSKVKQQQIRKKKHQNGLLLNKIQNAPTSTSIKHHEQNVPIRPKFLSPPKLLVANIASPKNTNFTKMFPIHPSFTSIAVGSKIPVQKQSIRLETNITKANEKQMKKTNQQSSKKHASECQKEKTLIKGKNTGSIAYLRGVNKQNNDRLRLRNISFDNKRQNRSNSSFKPGQITKVKLFKN